jgi:hypothetical protein
MNAIDKSPAKLDQNEEAPRPLTDTEVHFVSGGLNPQPLPPLKPVRF